MSYEHLEVRTEGLVDWVTMNRPDQLDALSRKLIDELRCCFLQVCDRRDVRVVILQGAGRASCAGLDLKEHAGRKHRRTPAEVLDSQRGIRDIVIAMRRCPQPIISIVNGAASGGGFARALADDMLHASPARAAADQGCARARDRRVQPGGGDRAGGSQPGAVHAGRRFPRGRRCLAREAPSEVRGQLTI